MEEMDILKERKVLDVRLARVTREINEYCSGNKHTESLTFRHKIPEAGRFKGYPLITGNFRSSRYGLLEDCVILTNPCAKYEAEKAGVRIFDILKTYEDWTGVIRFAKFEKCNEQYPINAKAIRENMGISPVGDRLMRSHQHLNEDEYDWFRFVEERDKPEWKEDWYIIDSIYMLNLYGQLMCAMYGG
jgi:hypothetical protein